MRTKKLLANARLLLAILATSVILSKQMVAQMPAHVSADGLVGWYGFDGHTEDASAYQNHATVIGAMLVPDRHETENRAYHLNGQGDFISVNHMTAHNSKPFTISIWVLPESAQDFSPVITKNLQGQHNGWSIEVQRTDDEQNTIIPKYTLQGANMNDACECGCSGISEGEGDCGSGINYDGALFDGQWHMITFVVDDTFGRLYVDGLPATEQIWAGPGGVVTNTSDIMIGAFRSQVGPWQFYNGFVDDLGIWQRALTESEVLSLFNEDPLPIPCNTFESAMYENIVGHWPFCGNTDDESPSDFHGQLNGAELTQDALGNAESAYHFENTSIELPVNADFLNEDFTIYIESRMPVFSDEYPTILSCAGLTMQYATTCDPTCLNVYLRGDGYEFAHVNIPITHAQWNSIALTRSEGLLWLYLNGQLWNIVDIDPNAAALSDNSITLGNTGGILENFTGDLDNVAIWTRALSDQEIFDISMSSGFIVFGCTDPFACNFNPLATVDDGSCGYTDWPCDDGNPNTINDTYNSLCDCEGMWGEWQEGCTDPGACNFDWFAVVEDGSCTYPWSPCDDGDSTTINTYLNWWCECVPQENCNDPWAMNFFPNATSDEDCEYAAEIYTFEDYNANGVWDSNEPSLANWPLAIFGSNSLIQTDAFGYAWVVTNSFNGEAAASDSIYSEWHNTTPLVLHTDWGWPVGIWGFTNTNPQGAYATVAKHLGWPPIIHCEDGLSVGAYINNSGGEPISAVVTISCGDTLEYTPNTTPEVVAISADTIVIDQISSYDFELASFHIDSPGLEYLDFSFVITVCAVVYDSLENVLIDTCFQYAPWVACSYDPNDLTANSPGHYDPHFISAGERVKFRVRFQNTGNYHAEDVLIRDVLDPMVWDISTFEPSLASVGGVVYENVQSTLNPLTGELSFLFNDINLPDSTVSPDLSQGFVEFYITTHGNLVHGTQLQNTAEIYFDNNPAIVTNTTNHTIFDCNTLSGPQVDTQLCEGDALELNATQQYVDSYTWQVVDDVFNGGVCIVESLPPGEHTIMLQLDNPLCSVMHEATVVVSVAPDNTLNTEGSMLSVESGNQWQWFFDDEPIDGATTPTLSAEAEGMYSVLITNQSNCQSEGEIQFIPNGVHEELDHVVSAWPNPMQSECRIQLPEEPCALALYDASGRLVKEEQLNGGLYVLGRDTLEAGMYQLVVTTKNNKLHQKLIVE